MSGRKRRARDKSGNEKGKRRCKDDGKVQREIDARGTRERLAF
jgi:hypothetical protein